MIDARWIIASVFKDQDLSDLERSDFDRQSFQYTWLNSYLLFRSIRESSSFATGLKYLVFS